MPNYILLRPDDFIQKGDLCRTDNKMFGIKAQEWKEIYSADGEKVSDYPDWEFKRPLPDILFEDYQEELQIEEEGFKLPS